VEKSASLPIPSPEEEAKKECDDSSMQLSRNAVKQERQRRDPYQAEAKAPGNVPVQNQGLKALIFAVFFAGLEALRSLLRQNIGFFRSL
jgi:hypothetical protein